MSFALTFGLHFFLCFFQLFFWHETLQYQTSLHVEQRCISASLCLQPAQTARDCTSACIIELLLIMRLISRFDREYTHLNTHVLFFFHF